LDKYSCHLSETSDMTLNEIIDFEGLQRNVQRMKLNAKNQTKQAKAAQARLKILKAQQQLTNDI